jgi:hypothetical protein
LWTRKERKKSLEDFLKNAGEKWINGNGIIFEKEFGS